MPTGIRSPTAATDSFPIPYHPFQTEQDLELLVTEIGDAKIVLLGESTHGTHEFYEWRTAITKKLVEEKGFDLIAIEGDWVDSYRVNRYINGPTGDSTAALNVLRQYDRWPSWMWGNYEMLPLIQWLNNYNNQEKKGIGFYGLDLYSFWECTQQDLPVRDTSLQRSMQKLKDYFAPYQNDAMKYTDDLRKGKRSAESLVADFYQKASRFLKNNPSNDEAHFLLEQQASLAMEGEKFFRQQRQDRIQALNIRDGYMAATLNRLLKFYGPDAKAILWVHNGHAGDNRYSNPGNNGYINLGEILKKQWGSDRVYSVGSGTYKGYVTAGYYWNGERQNQPVLPAKEGSWEALLHKTNNEDKLILSRELRDIPWLNKWMEFRSIGAAYPGAALYNYSIIPKRFDAFVFIDSTKGTRPLTTSGFFGH